MTCGDCGARSNTYCWTWGREVDLSDKACRAAADFAALPPAEQARIDELVERFPGGMEVAK